MDGLEGDNDDFLDSFQSLIEHDDGSMMPFFPSYPESANSSVCPTNALDRGSKKRKCNPDADAIALVTEESMRALNVDLDSKDAKKMRRQIRNRLSAQFHRDRKNSHIKDLESAVAEKAQQISLLEKELKQLKDDNMRLLGLLSQQQQQSSSSSCTSSTSSEGSLTDAESALSSPYTSPFHEPMDHRAFSAMLPQMQGLPLPRALGFMAVLAVLAVCCMGNMPFPAAMTPLPSLQQHQQHQPVQPQAAQVLGRRRLSATEASNSSAPPEHTHMHLRRQPQDTSSTSSSSSSANTSHLADLFVRKDMVPFHAGQQYWQPGAGFSLSRIVMQGGVALFDPSLQLQAQAQDWPQATASAAGAASQVVPSARLLSAPPVSAAHAVKEQGKAQQPQWPALPPPPQAQAVDEGSTCRDCYAGLLARSNLVTVTLPASAIRMGTSLDNSQDGTMEGIIRMFNLTEATAPGDQMSAAMVEIDCILLNAKLMVK